ncbi:hypothetical protein GQX73_g5226 [Xylaria multiplex]|uniref:Uncharacterized protein n=1 Tax=Xylaria multiplex TaxID=323545 RepID=A0A7C8IUM5_9PEZI|nr:hypothetical protein GQX73_g5226 [Xylaria multiplex]
MSRPMKRARVEPSHSNVGPPPAPPLATGPSYEEMIGTLSDFQLRWILTHLSLTSRSSQAAIVGTYQHHLRIQQQRVVNFDHFAVAAWHLLNTSSYTRLSSSKQFEMSSEVLSELRGCIESVSQETPNESSYGTKLNALEALRKIAKTILLSAGSTLSQEIRKEFQWESCLGDAMLRIAESMTNDELLRAGATADARSSLVDKMHWIHHKAKSSCLDGFAAVERVVELLGGPPETLVDDEEDYTEDGEHDDA